MRIVVPMVAGSKIRLRVEKQWLYTAFNKLYRHSTTRYYLQQKRFGIWFDTDYTDLKNDTYENNRRFIQEFNNNVDMYHKGVRYVRNKGDKVLITNEYE